MDKKAEDYKLLSDVKAEKASFILTEYIPLPVKAVTILNSMGGVGKALWVDERVLTPEGWKQMKDLKLNDYVIGSDGKKTRVTGIYYQGVRQSYKLTFTDNTSVICDSEHLWTVYSSRGGGTFTVNELIEKGIYRDKYDKRYDTVQREFYYGIPICSSGYEFGKDGFILHPYILGVLLGDGYLRKSITFCNKHKWVMEKVKSLLPEGDSMSCYFKNGAYQCSITGKGRKRSVVSLEIEKYGLIGKKSSHKFIPNAYKNATLESRKQIIQGLTDTDGYVKNGNLQEYSTSSLQLAKDFLDVGRSIGMFLTIKDRIPYFMHNNERKAGLRSYRIYQKKHTNKKIISIEPAGKREMMCITVDNPDGLFVTNGYNLTHNSRLSLLIADRLSSLEGKKTMLWLSEDYPGQVRSIYNQFVENNMTSMSSMKDIVVVNKPAVQLAYVENRVFKPNLDELKRIADDILDVDASLLVLDPLLSFYGGNENDNSQATIFMLSLIEIAKMTEIAILLIHHNRKPGMDADNEFRGATAFHNSCRARYSLDYVRDKDKKVDVEQYNAGYRTLRLEKDNWGLRKYFNKLTNGSIDVRIRIAPAWER